MEFPEQTPRQQKASRERNNRVAEGFAEILKHHEKRNEHKKITLFIRK